MHNVANYLTTMLFELSDQWWSEARQTLLQCLQFCHKGEFCHI